jgi:hypothetical protein
MTKQTRLALLAVAAVTVASSAQAQYSSGDLIVGFTTPSNPVNDFLLDIGSASSLYNGETWSLGTAVQSITNNGSAVFGVIGYSTGPNTIYSTTLNITPPSLNGAEFNQVRTTIDSVGNNNLSLANSAVVASGSGSSTSESWYSETAQPVGTPGYYFYNTYVNPNVGIGSAADLWSAVANSSFPAPVILGDFTVSADASTLTYTVPEPATATLAGLGLLGLLFARKAARQP